MNELRTDDIFNQVREMDHAQRAAVLDSLSAEDREAVQSLVQADQLAADQNLFECLEPSSAKIVHNESLVGTRVRDYEVLDFLGAGGMGRVYRARHIRLRRDFAIKILPQLDHLQNSDTVARFEREMAAVGLLRHSHIVEATDAGEENGLHYLVLEYVDGTDVGKIINYAGKLSLADACEIVRQTSLGLQHAHEQSLVHRDVKPSNLLIDRNGTVKIADMGISLLQADSDLTTPGQIMGSLDYIAPEQVERPGDVDHRADVYSLGCTFYHLLVGRAPFQTPEFAGAASKIRAHERVQPESLEIFRDDVPEEIQNLVRSMLEKSPDDRCANAEAVSRALEQYSDGSHLVALVESVDIPTQAEIATDRVPTGDLDTRCSSDAPKQIRSQASIAEQSSRWLRSRYIVLAAVLVAALTATCYRKPAIRFFTNQGVLVLENAKGIDVTLVQEDGPLQLDGSRGKEYEFDAGESYHLTLRDPVTSVEVKTKPFTIGRNERITFDVRFELDSARRNDIGGTPDKVDHPAERMTPLNYARWALGTGDAVRVAGYDAADEHFNVVRPEQLPNGDLGAVIEGMIGLRNRETQSTCIETALARLPREFHLSNLVIFERAPSASALRAIAQNKDITNLRFHGEFDFGQLAELPANTFPRVTTLLFREHISVSELECVVERFPNVRRLNVSSVATESGDLLSRLPLDYMVIDGGHSIPDPSPIQQVESITGLGIYYYPPYQRAGEEAHLDRLPPNISSLILSDLNVTATHLDQLSEYQDLRMVQLLYSSTESRPDVTIEQIEMFRNSHPNIELSIEGQQTGPGIQQEPPSKSIAAFDNRKGFSYVYQDNGRYDKVINFNNRLYHRLHTGYYWKHAMDRRYPMLTAAFTLNRNDSYVFYSSGEYTQLHNPSNIGVKTRPITEDWTGKLARDWTLLKAAMHWSDNHSYLFFDDGYCSKLSPDLDEVSVEKTEVLFPNLKGKSTSLTAARYAQTVDLAYFYFADGSYQVYDCKAREVIDSVPARTTPWKVPVSIQKRARPLDNPRETGEEIVRWSFQHGAKEVVYRTQAGILRTITEVADYETRDVVGCVVDSDVSQAATSLYALARMGDGFPREEFASVVIEGEHPLAPEFERRLGIVGLDAIHFECPVAIEQLKFLPTRQIRELGLAHPDLSMLDFVAKRFPALKQLELGATKLQASTLNSLKFSPTLRKLLLRSPEFERSELSKFEMANPNVDVRFLVPEG
ncbi:MAG: hypothetical protein Aurels2KO_18980 [Aureliella sp.]